MSNTKGRYGISALDTKYLEYAQPDEILIEGDTGHIFYKREDGQIVSYSDNKYTKETLVSAMQTAIGNSDTEFETADGDFLVYHTMKIAGTHNILRTTPFSFNSKVFPISPAEGAFFVRFRGNDRTNSTLSFLDNQYKAQNAGTTKKMVTLSFAVEEVGDTPTDTASYTINVDMDIDILVNVVIPSTVTNRTSLSVKLISMKFPIALPAFDSLSDEKKNEMQELNLGNTVLEGEYIDFVTYVNDITEPTLYDNASNIKIEFILPMESVIDLESSVGGQSIIISTEQPKQECIWGQLKTRGVPKS